jgi:replicative DNA helicase
VLYVAADRPEQVRRSLHRLVRPEDRAELDARLSFWPGPLPHDLARRPTILAEMARDQDADTVIVDSLKDVAVKLTDDEVGALVNRAFQEVIAAEVELLGLHHQRKEQRGGGKPKGLADVYGSGWITAGCGSVLLLWGEPGDAAVELCHLKQAAAEVGPFQVIHDGHAGSSSVEEHADTYTLLRDAPAGLTAVALAAEVHGTPSPTRNQVEKARRQLDGLVRSGRATKQGGGRGGGAERDLARYFLTVPEEAR